MDKLNLPSKPSSQQELSANEFQEKLYNWLQDQGLISELRGHLRTQMVTAFQDNAAVSNTNKQFSASPKVQALSTLVADFLLQQGFSYTLSVFVTEVPLIGQVFSQFSQSAIKKTLESGFKFAPREVEDILETLGIAPGSQLFLQALSLYHSNGGTPNQVSEPLLLCIMRALSSQFNRKESEFSNGKKDTRGQNALQLHEVSDVKLRKSEKDISGIVKESWIEGLDDSLLQNNLKLCPITCLQEYMKRVHEEELYKVREEEAAKYKDMLEEKLKEFEKKDLTDKHRGLKEWKEAVEMEFNEREKNLCQLAKELRAQHLELSEKVAFLEIESQEMKERERQFKTEHERGCKDLELKKSEIEMQKARLNEAYERLAADQEAVNKIQNSLLERKTTSSVKEDPQNREILYLKKIQEQYDSLCQLLTLKKSNDCAVSTKDFFGNCDISTDVVREDKALQTSEMAYDYSDDVENDFMNRIEDEKRELNERVFHQRQRIDELTIRAAELSNQLQDAQVAMQLMMPNQFTVTTPPLTAPPTPRLHPRPQWPPHIGSGEETAFVAMRPQVVTTTLNTTTTTTVPTVRQTGAVRRRPRRTIIQQSRPIVNLNISSDSSTATTDEMIEEARIRLRRLEQESSGVQHNYEEFRNRQSNLESTASIVFHPDQLRSINPFDGFRRTNYSSSFSPYPTPNIARGTSHSRSFVSRLPNLSVSRPIFSSFYSGLDQPSGNNDYGITNVCRNTVNDSIAKELDESLADDILANERGTVREQFIPPIQTTSPTDVSPEINDAHQPLKKKVVHNTLKNHSLNNDGNEKIVGNDRNDNEEKLSSNIKSNQPDKNKECNSPNTSKDKDKLNSGVVKKDVTSRLQFCDMVTVVNEATSFSNNFINNDIPVFSSLVEHLGHHKTKYSVVQEPLKVKDNGICKNRKRDVEIVDIGDSSSDLTDDDENVRQRKRDSNLRKFVNYKADDESDITDNDNDDEKISKNVDKVKKLEKCKPDISKASNSTKDGDNSPQIRFDNSDISEEYLTDSAPVEVLLQRRSIKTSSSSTPFSDNKQGDNSHCEDDEHHVVSNGSELEINVDQVLVKSQSLPAPITKSFFSSEEDGYTLKNFESGVISCESVVTQGDDTSDSKRSQEKCDVACDDKINKDLGDNKKVDVDQESSIVLKSSTNKSTENPSVNLDQIGSSFLQLDPDHVRSWREPGDGTDEVFSESDGAVSAGTQDDTASSFW